MKVTVVQLPEDQSVFEQAMADLADHVRAEKSQFLLLPEMPFSSWMAYEKTVDPEVWAAAVDTHTEWISRLGSFGVDLIVGSKPVLQEGHAHNDAFILSNDSEQFLHRKYYLPNEGGFWEATWYERASSPDFNSVKSAENVVVGAMICSDIWFGEHARSYARQGVHLLVNPRATGSGSLEKWLAGGQAAAVMSGAYCLSSNRYGPGQGFDWGGMGWIIDPDGEVLARTSAEQPFVTMDLDLSVAEKAKSSYPRDVRE